VNACRELIEALRDYWTARADLERATGGTVPMAAGAPSTSPQPELHHDHAATCSIGRQPPRRWSRLFPFATGGRGRAIVPHTRRSAERAVHPGRDPNGSTLPWTVKDGVKGVPTRRRAGEARVRTGMVSTGWGYNGQTPGPTIEVVEGTACASS